MPQSIRTAKPYDPAEDAALLLMRLGLLVLFVALPLGTDWSRRSLFLTYPIGLVLVLLSIFLVMPRSTRARIFTFRIDSLLASALFLGLWSLISLLWTPNWYESWGFASKAGLSMFFAALACRALPEHTRSANLYLISIGVFLAVIAVLLQAVSRSLAEGIKPVDERVGMTMIVLVWPALAALAIRRHVAWAGALAILTTLALIVTRQVASVTILACGAIVYSIAMSSGEKAEVRRKLAQILGLAFAALVLLAPVLALIAGLFSSDAHGVAVAVKQSLVSDFARLVTGRGIGAASHSELAALIPGSAHWLMFEIWFDLGVLGALTLAALIYRTFIASLMLRPVVADFMLSALTCTALLSLTGQGMAQIWWVTLLCSTAIAFQTVINGQYRTHRPGALRSV